jgi:hypothetical protein
MSEPTCQNCRHWSRDDEYDYVPSATMRRCDLLSSSNLSDNDPAGAYWENRRGGNSGIFFSQPTFSCNQHQPREE